MLKSDSWQLGLSLRIVQQIFDRTLNIMRPNFALAFLQKAGLLSKRHISKETGFTLIEVLVIVIIIGILAAIAAPSWLAFTNARRLTATQDDLFTAIQEAKRNAKKDKIAWQVSFSQPNAANTRAQYAVHRTDVNPSSNANTDQGWKSFRQARTRIDASRTNLRNIGTDPNQWAIIFNSDGCPVVQPGEDCNQTGIGSFLNDPTPTPSPNPVVTGPNASRRITIQLQGSGSQRRCIRIKTILGTIESDRNEGCNS